MYRRLADVYDVMYTGKEYDQEVREILRIAARSGMARPSSLLDVGCGTGRHLDQFRRQVPEVAGVDRSPEMLAIARRRLGRSVPLTEGDMRSFDLGRTFDVVVCLFSAFGYMVTRRDRDRAARAFARHLSPGGVALVQGWIRPSRWLGGSSHLLTREIPGLTLARLTVSTRRGRRSLLDTHYLIARPGRAVEHLQEVHRNALVPEEEILASFRRAGLRASVRTGGRWRDRGLYVAVRPKARPST